MKSLGTILAMYRNEHKYKQAEVAEILKTKYQVDASKYALSHWEKEISLPNARQFLALCDLYQIANINNAFQVAMGDDPFYKLSDEGQEKVRDYTNVLAMSGLYERKEATIIPFRRTIKKYYLAASAGTGQYLDSDAYDMIEVGDEVSPLADFGITLAGNSMEPQFINGQTVWVHSQETLNNGEIGIFYYNGDAYCKKYYEGDDCINLISLNPSYEPINVDEEKGFRIFGKVVG